MYNDFYQFSEDPFFLTPDSRSLFLPENHKAVLDSILSGINERKGFMAVIGKKGVGKTACLVHIATDQLFLNKHVIHVSFSGDTRHIISWYEDIFKEIRPLPLYSTFLK